MRSRPGRETAFRDGWKRALYDDDSACPRGAKDTGSDAFGGQQCHGLGDTPSCRVADDDGVPNFAVIQHGKAVFCKLVDRARCRSPGAFSNAALIQSEGPIMGRKSRNTRVPEVRGAAQAADKKQRGSSPGFHDPQRGAIWQIDCVFKRGTGGRRHWRWL